MLKHQKREKTLTKAIPAKIKPYPGLVKAWRARYGRDTKPLGLYDPPRKRKSTRLGSRTRRKTADPKKRRKRRSMATGYGRINSKPYKRGPRGGTYWSGGRKPRYDPQRRSRRSKARGKLDGMFNQIQKRIDPICDLIGFLTGLIAPLKSAYDTYMESGFWQYPSAEKSIGNFFKLGVPMEVSQLLNQPVPGGRDKGLGTIKYLEYKFLNDECRWKAPFWASLGVYLACKFGIPQMLVGLVSKKATRIFRPIQKIAGGALVATTLGALVLPGTKPANAPSSGNPGHSNASRNPASMYG